MGSRVVVPDGMFIAALRETKDGQTPQIHTILEAALHHLSEHPIEPTDQQAAELANELISRRFDSSEDVVKWCAVEWMRRAFRVPSLDVPEDLDQLFWADDACISAKGANKTLIEAYRLGQRSAGKAGA